MVVSGICVRLTPKMLALNKEASMHIVELATERATRDEEHAVSIDNDGPFNANANDILPEATLSADPVAENGVILLIC